MKFYQVPQSLIFHYARHRELVDEVRWLQEVGLSYLRQKDPQSIGRGMGLLFAANELIYDWEQSIRRTT